MSEVYNIMNEAEEVELARGVIQKPPHKAWFYIRRIGNACDSPPELAGWAVGIKRVYSRLEKIRKEEKTCGVS